VHYYQQRGTQRAWKHASLGKLLSNFSCVFVFVPNPDKPEPEFNCFGIRVFEIL
jgi:hypothetical protein